MHKRPQALGLFSVATLSLLGVTGEAMAIEEPKYTVIEKSGDIEIRRYQERLVAEVEITGAFEEAGSLGFRPLADFIFGNNVPAEKIAMTSPVTQQNKQERDGHKIAMTAPVTQAPQGGAYLVQFTMPSQYTLKTLPTPRDRRVKLRVLPAQTVAAIRYSGRWTQANYDNNLKKLRSYISNQDRLAAGEPRWARYNAPYIPWFLRRNEVLIPLHDKAMSIKTSASAPQASAEIQR